MDPPLKKLKTQEPIIKTIDTYINKMRESKENLHAVLGDDFTKPIPLIKVYAGHVKNPKDLSRIILTLNEKVPLKELSHLKRVRKREVILCPIDCLNGVSIQQYLEVNVQNLYDVFEYFREIEVPMYAPKVKKQCNMLAWSYNFHPNMYYEKLVSDDFFSVNEMNIHKKYMEIAFVCAKWYIQEHNRYITDLLDMNITLVIDPLVKSNSVVAISCNNENHPIQHSAMVAIDNVAKTQKGGVWNVSDNTVYNLKGIDEKLHQHLTEIYPEENFGARNYMSKDEASDCDSSDGPYLCTGYYIYMIKEPCVMCSMALVHARAKRIFYTFPNELCGALCSKVKLQSVPSLNHRFEVFTGFL
ncbi:probable inactive tRNA-specific adenosine deaminase-like protein 3 [Hyposmocoma kahamanoa]|uniref:probable inactive tRNA-specific adenosine deaminase-like protein 3 n=1 Tax=Hyposmocoma kahamanoa TaxID=1477025 RepID=UPI000E6D9719|nr:probable inactive tRNA-specific adenosine deaminase-like protein 3 [Hyposmocoma kahamanoa]